MSPDDAQVMKEHIEEAERNLMKQTPEQRKRWLDDVAKVGWFDEDR